MQATQKLIFNANSRTHFHFTLNVNFIIPRCQRNKGQNLEDKYH